MIWVLLQSDSPLERNDSITFFLFIFLFLCTRRVWKKSLKGICTCHNCLNYGKVEQILWEFFGKILKLSFKTVKRLNLGAF